jgi:hypothetical protein
LRGSRHPGRPVSSKPAEIKLFLAGTLDATRLRELTDGMLAAAILAASRVKATAAKSSNSASVALANRAVAAAL